MTSTALRRIQKEFRDITDHPLDNLSIEPKEENLFEWDCSITAESDSPYKGGTFKFTLTLPSNFPFKAPSVQFKTKIYHPGINEDGAICVPVLRDEVWSNVDFFRLLMLVTIFQQWKPSVTLATVLSIIQDKLNNPSHDDPFEPDIAALLKNDKSKFLATAKEWTKKYAM
ncbi:hypothetical protein D9757_001960 [Collybiopsis confluens]|uniref:UBC core domain-containing protein n=1 Tax=Collybiopsis confluens TaxID=2823264 RepID=A0A8H5HXB3_9AGAR|nr:hypothetical protein D9757_001960 [Collybiopsis confluens]